MSAINQNFSDAARRWRALSENIDQAEREALAPIVVAEVNQLLGEFGINRNKKSASFNPSILQHLTEKGVAELGALLRPQQTLDIKVHLQSCPTYGAHFAAQSNGLALGGNASEFACYRLPDIAATPHVIEIANDPALISMAEQYLGCVPTIYSLIHGGPAPPGMRAPEQRSHFTVISMTISFSHFLFISRMSQWKRDPISMLSGLTPKRVWQKYWPNRLT